ncbi:MAG: hypothetical protein WDZ93_00040 [Candidatus Paceibacterota bacterium]
MFNRRRKGRRRRGTSPHGVLIRQILIGLTVLLLLGGVGTGIWYGTRTPALTITTIEVVGGDTVPHGAVRSVVAGQLEGAYFKLVPHRFAWLYPDASIQSEVERIPRVKDASVERTSGTEVVVDFTEYQPYALWCEPLRDERCLFLDEAGYAFEVAPELMGNSFVRYIDSEQTPELGTFAYEQETGVYFKSVVALLEAQHDLTVTQVEQSAPDELTFHLVGGSMIKTSLRVSPEETIRNLDTVLASDEFAHFESGNFAYIDLRYGDRVFVKEEFGTETATSTATSTEVEE